MKQIVKYVRKNQARKIMKEFVKICETMNRSLSREDFEYFSSAINRLIVTDGYKKTKNYVKAMESAHYLQKKLHYRCVKEKLHFMSPQEEKISFKALHKIILQNSYNDALKFIESVDVNFLYDTMANILTQ